MPSLAESFRRVRSTETCLRCAACVNLNQVTTSVFSFVRDLIQKGRPSGIVNAFGKHSTCQAFNVQVLDSDNSEVRHQPMTDFVVKVRALVSDVRVCAPKKLNGFPATVRAFLATGNFALRLAECGLCRSGVARVINLCAIGERGKRSQADIYADAGSGDRQRLCFTLDRETGVPTSGFTLNRERLRSAFKRTMQFDFDFADFRQTQMRAVERKSELRIGERVVACAGTEAWESDARASRFRLPLHPSKERFERLVNSVQRVLQYLRVDAAQLRSDFFNLDKLRALSGEVDACTVDAPRIAPFLQSRVIEFLARAKRPFEQSGLLLSGIDSVLKSLSHPLNRNDEYRSFFTTRHPRRSAVCRISPCLKAGALRHIW